MFNLPNCLTLMNLLCGCLASMSLIQGEFKMTLIFFGAALAFDLFDGLAARALKQSSKLGGELDSLADMVSFGFFPGLMLFYLIDQLSGDSTGLSLWPAAIGFCYTLAACMRLAKFNIDERQTTDFLGLNTPAASIAIIGLYINQQSSSCGALFQDVTFVVVATILLSVLLLVDLPMISFKFDFKNRSRTITQSILIGVGIIILIFLSTCALPFLILWYILLSIANVLIKKVKK